MPHDTLSLRYGDPLPENLSSSAQVRQQAAEEVRILEGVLRRGRVGASDAWLSAARHEVDRRLWLRWRRSAGDASRLD